MDKPATEFTEEHALPKSMGGKLRPTNPFTEVAAAHQYIHDRKSKGKVLLVP